MKRKIFLIFLYLLALPGSIWADAGVTVNGTDISAGSGTGWTFSGGELKITSVGDYTLSGSADGTVGVTIDANCNVTLKDLTISNKFFNIAAGRHVNLYLSGDNALRPNDENTPALGVPSGASITIDAAEGASAFNLIARTPVGGDAAAIGGASGQTSGDITIAGGHITASAPYGSSGARIGGGEGGHSGTITICGGTIIASNANSSIVPDLSANTSYSVGNLPSNYGA